MSTNIEWTRVNNDVNGNPRYVCHYLNLITDADRESGDTSYSTALYNAKKIGGKKFHNKQYGGGIVFQSYSIQDTERHIMEMVKGE